MEPLVFVNEGVRELAALLFDMLNIASLPRETPEKPLDFVAFIKTYVGDVFGAEYDTLWFKMRLYRDWLEERISTLENDVKRKLQDTIILAKFQNSLGLLQAGLRWYWNKVVRTLNEAVQTGLMEVIVKHKEYMQYRRDAGEKRGFVPKQTAYLEQWYLVHIQNPYPSPEECIRIAFHIHLLPQQVATWFSNKRSRSKKQKEAHKRSNTELVLEHIDRVEEDLAQILSVPVVFDDQGLWQPFISLTANEGSMYEQNLEFITPDETFYNFYFL